MKKRNQFEFINCSVETHTRHWIHYYVWLRTNCFCGNKNPAYFFYRFNDCEFCVCLFCFCCVVLLLQQQFQIFYWTIRSAQKSSSDQEKCGWIICSVENLQFRSRTRARTFAILIDRDNDEIHSNCLCVFICLQYNCSVAFGYCAGLF